MIPVLIPTYNERETIGELLSRITALPSFGRLSLVIIDDHSPDGTAAVVEAVARRFPNVRLWSRPGKLGIGSAYREGMRQALADPAMEAVVTMDADLSHAPEDLERLLAKLDAGVEVVIGSRRIPGGRIVGWGWHRHFASRGATWLSRALLGLRTHDVTSGFRCYARRAVQLLTEQRVQSDGYAYLEETLWFLERRRLIIEEVPITFNDRRSGRSKLSRREIFLFFVTLGHLAIRQQWSRFRRDRRPLYHGEALAVSNESRQSEKEG